MADDPNETILYSRDRTNGTRLEITTTLGCVRVRHVDAPTLKHPNGRARSVVIGVHDLVPVQTSIAKVIARNNASRRKRGAR